MEPRPPGIVFVIIHGTASRGARWTRPDSKIRRRLERHFDRRGRTVNFEWTGINTDTARLTAAGDLARRILELHEEYHAPIYLVAHSHGGNIALYAMREASVEEKVTGVICLGTSFLKCSQRPYIRAIEKCLELVPRMAGATALGVIALMQFTGRGGGRRAELNAVLFVGFVAAARKLWMPWYRRMCGHWVESLRGPIQSKNDATMAALSLPLLPNLKLLCLSTPNDEVGKCLRLSIFFSEMPFYAWRFLDRVSDVVIGVKKRPPNLLTIAFYAGAGAAIVGMLSGGRRFEWLHWLTLLVLPRLAGLVFLIVAAPLLILCQLILVVTPRLPGVLSHGFGDELILSNWFTRFTVEPAPGEPRDCVVKEVSIVAGKLNFRAPNIRTFWAATAHTKLYNNREVMREMMRWIYECEKSRTELEGADFLS